MTVAGYKAFTASSSSTEMRDQHDYPNLAWPYDGGKER
jgi:hypothetical protein